jgi:hypothetical protein
MQDPLIDMPLLDLGPMCEEMEEGFDLFKLEPLEWNFSNEKENKEGSESCGIILSYLQSILD